MTALRACRCLVAASIVLATACAPSMQGQGGSGGNGTSTTGTGAQGGAAGRAGTGTGGAASGSGGSPGTGGNPSVGVGGGGATGGSAAGSGGAGTGSGGGGGVGPGVGSGGRAASTGGTGIGGDAGPTGGAGVISGPLVPAQGALLGAFVGTGTLAQLETTLGRKLAIVHHFVGWTDDYAPLVRTDVAGGRIPLITWEAWVNGVGTSLDDIIGGVHDTMIRTRAQAMKDIAQPVFLRWGHEMNGNWYPWSGFSNGASAAATAKFIAAYRHIHDVFTSIAAANVIWLFCPNVDSVPTDAWNQWTDYYPGDAYVDWMGIDGYNWGTSQVGSTWEAFPAIMARIYAGVAAKGKPVMIPETASSELGGDKAAWIAAMLPALKVSFPAIKALVWFHMTKETDWRIDSSAASRDAFVPMANDPYFNP